MKETFKTAVTHLRQLKETLESVRPLSATGTVERFLACSLSLFIIGSVESRGENLIESQITLQGCPSVHIAFLSFSEKHDEINNILLYLKCL